MRPELQRPCGDGRSAPRLAGAPQWAGAAAILVGIPTLRLHGLYFAIATLAFAEMVRLLFELFRYQLTIDGELVGPNGTDGFRGIRYIFENDVSSLQFLALIYLLLIIALVAFMLLERSRLGVTFRMIGEDATLAELNGVAVARIKVLAAGLAGALAGVGGGLYAHLTTYVEPRIFDVMLGVHSLAYGLIGGLGTALGPLIGVAHRHRPSGIRPRVRRLSHDHLRRPGCSAADRAAARIAGRDEPCII